MKFGKYLEEKRRSLWSNFYLDYGALKDLLKECVSERDDPGQGAWASPRVTSLSVVRAPRGAKDPAEERFFRALEGEVSKVGRHTAAVVTKLRGRQSRLLERIEDGDRRDAALQRELMEEAKAIGDEILQLEKYVNLNYMGFHKILKKHDKLLPDTPCRQFYVSHLHNQPWVQGNYSDLMVVLSNCFSLLRGDTLAGAQGGSAQAFNRSTTKYWVRTDDVSAVKRVIIENMPVFVFNKDSYSGDAQLVNSVYFDNDSLELYHGRLDKKPGAIAFRIRWYGPNEPSLCFVERKIHRESWKGEKSVKERFTLPEHRIVPYCEGDYTVDMYEADLRLKGKGEEDVARAAALFLEIQQTIDSKQLKPLVRTQYMRSAFQMGHDRTVSFTLDTNLVMLKENAEGHPTCATLGRWYRDPGLPVHRTEITRFPHAVLEIKLALPEGDAAPDWVKDLMESGLITEVHKMSKFIHGTATLFPDMVQAVPYWVDDESIRASILASATEPRVGRGRDGASLPHEEASTAAASRRRARQPGSSPPRDDLGEPLLLGSSQDDVLGASPTPPPPSGGAEGLLVRLLRAAGVGGAPSEKLLEATPQRLEPKTFLASERTFLSWLHMAVTLAAIASALLAFAGAAKDKHDPLHKVGGNLVVFVALLLLPLAIAIVAYAVVAFHWRSTQIALKRAAAIDDQRGPYLLVTLVVLALSAIFLASCIDLVDALREKNGETLPSNAGFLQGGTQLPNGFQLAGRLTVHQP
ncbi:VTC domain-containing protein [Helicosporidium sp. ATCC 50920]|nr:VTC domain-containing protein [Helicosporidium sp. ATCC 50920]|eukprot:KDD74760.1 VTC domain-containing protein [Helicosporidium sp. ATCC 50920]